MAISSPSFSFTIFFLTLQLLFPGNLHAKACNYTSIISFGNSLADTGNIKSLVSYQNSTPPHFLFPPYGESFFHKPTGRCSNGRILIDFTAEGMGLPLVPPYLGGKGRSNNNNLGGGVNYAVVGATALDSSFFEARGVSTSTNASLRVQLQWFKRSLRSVCDTFPDCKHIIGHSLILMGEIGGNDYNHQLLDNTSIDQVKPYVPLVISTIILAINEVIQLGAKTIVVPGNLPIGCSTAYLTAYYGSNDEDYDNITGCHVPLNKFAEYHNEMLKNGLIQIRALYPNTNIIYADYYNAAMQFFRSPKHFGFLNGALKACCGGGGPYNYNASAECGYPSSTACLQPDTYFNWDGIHLTEAAYRLMYKSLFQGPYTIPRFDSLCPNIKS